MSEIIKAEIGEMNMLGNGITKQDGCVVFCLGAVDGDVVEAEITQVKKNYKIAKVLNIEKTSPHRCENDCANFGECGGCLLRHISYEHELDIKRNSIENAFRRVGLGNIRVDEIISDSPERYRNKVVFHFTDGGTLGYMAEKGHDIISIHDCLICPDVFMDIASFTSDALKKAAHNLTYLFIRSNHDKSELNVIIGVKSGEKADLTEYAEALTERFPAVVGVLRGEGEHPEENNNYKTIVGVPYVKAKFCGLDIKVSPASFFQVNYNAAEKLCRKAAELAAPMPGEFGADLYCGTGTIGLVTASMFEGSFITGVEINEKAVADAKENAKANGLDNIGYYSGDSADFVKSSYGTIDFTIIDPPRAGCSDRMIKDLIRLAPERIVCVSCAPDTLARDLKKLTDSGYKVMKTVMCDFFPRTKHVESIVCLSRE